MSVFNARNRRRLERLLAKWRAEDAAGHYAWQRLPPPAQAELFA